jgi:hypothetical protein
MLPRKYVFCHKNNPQKAMSKSAFINVLNHMYSDVSKNESSSITLLRRAYVSKLHLNEMSTFEIEDIAERMRVGDAFTLLVYRVLG